MTGGLIQVASSGEYQGAYLTGDPEVTYWRQRWARHSNFAIESVKMDFIQEPKFNTQCSCIISRQGDLLYQAYLQVTMTKGANVWPKAKGGYHPIEALVKDVTLSIGGIVVDRLYSDWFRIYDTFHRTHEQSEAYTRMTNFDVTSLGSEQTSTETLYLPLNFYFSRSPGVAIPLINLFLAEVKLTFNFASAYDVGVLDSNFSAAIYADMVYLDSDEREVFSSSTIDYLIEQVQHVSKKLEGTEAPSETEMRTVRCKLPFLRPVKALYWVLKETNTDPDMTTHGRYIGDLGTTYLSYQPVGGSHGLMQSISEKLAPVQAARLTIQGVDRFSSRPGNYFNKVQPFQHAKKAATVPGMYMYSFSLALDDSHPTGSANFSTLSDAELVLTLKQSVSSPIVSSDFSGAAAETKAKNITGLKELLVFGWSFNVLRFENGMCGLLFGN
jgi:hypothetical protein